jgi:hypothetical protein
MSFTFSGDSFNINYWYIDDIKLMSFSSIGDGFPADNTLTKLITLSYEHDVGVVGITEPSYNPFNGRDDVIFHQGYWTPDEAWAFDTSATTSGYVCYDDFYGLTADIGDVEWYGLTLINSGGWFEGTPVGMTFVITFYEDNGAGQPGAVVAEFPGLAPTYVDTGYDYIGFSQWHWSMDLPTSVGMTDGWMSIVSEPASDSAWLMWATGPDGTANAWQLQSGVLVALGQNMCFNLSKAPVPPGGDWPPGVYHVKGIVQNIGVTYPEADIPVNAKITHVDNNTVIYDQNTVVPGPLAPGETATAVFPDFELFNLTAWEGNYKVEIKTALPGDDHPNNDKKTMTFKMAIPDIIPPITTHSFTGTLGNNGWYVSNVVITLNATDPFPPVSFGDGPKPPSGVKQTYYSFDNVNWFNYTGVPVTISTDGIYNLYYYSVDNAGNIEAVKGPFNFKMDKTAPTITLNFTSDGGRRWTLTAEVSDATSGVARVEFYVDDVPIGNVTTAPFVITGKGGKLAQAIAYDNAGNSQMSNEVQSLSLDLNTQSQPLMQNEMLSGRQLILLQK